MLLVLLLYLTGCKRLASRDYLDRNYAKASDILFEKNENGQIISKNADTVSFGAINENEHILQLVGYGLKTSFVKMSNQNIQFEIKNNNEKLYILTAFSIQNGDYFDNEIIQAVNKDSGKIETRVNNLTDLSGEKYLLATSKAFTNLVERVAAVENSLNTKIQILERNITILNNQNAQLEKSVNDLNSQNSELEINIENLNSQNSELEESANKLNNENNELKNDVNMLRSEASKWESMYYSAIKTPTSKPATYTPTKNPATITPDTSTAEPASPTPEFTSFDGQYLNFAIVNKSTFEISWNINGYNKFRRLVLYFNRKNSDGSVKEFIHTSLVPKSGPNGDIDDGWLSFENEKNYFDVDASAYHYCQGEPFNSDVFEANYSKKQSEQKVTINLKPLYQHNDKDTFELMFCPAEGLQMNEKITLDKSLSRIELIK